jgi:hypothetical protein
MPKAAPQPPIGSMQLWDFRYDRILKQTQLEKSLCYVCDTVRNFKASSPSSLSLSDWSTGWYRHRGDFEHSLLVRVLERIPKNIFEEQFERCVFELQADHAELRRIWMREIGSRCWDAESAAIDDQAQICVGIMAEEALAECAASPEANSDLDAVNWFQVLDDNPSPQEWIIQRYELVDGRMQWADYRLPGYPLFFSTYDEANQVLAIADIEFPGEHFRTHNVSVCDCHAGVSA